MDDTSAPDSRHLHEALGAAVFVAVAYLVLRTAPALTAGAFSDDGVYLALGRALAEGDGFRSVYAVGDPVHMKYPPGLPLLYAVLWKLGGDLATVHAGATLLSLVATSVAAGLLWWIARVRLKVGPALAAIFAIGPFLLEGSIQYFNLPISEPWFMLGWALCLVAFPRAVEGRVGWCVVLGLIAAATTLIRTQAVVLVPALVVAAWLKGRDWRRPTLIGVAAMAPVVLWMAWHATMVAAGPGSSQPDEAAYVSWTPGSVGGAFGLVAEIVRSQVVRYSTALPLHLAPWVWLGGALWIAVSAGFLLGAWRLSAAFPAVVLSAGGLAAVVFLWPYSQDRFVLALLPFIGTLVAAWLQGVRMSGRLGPSIHRAGSLALVATVLVVGARQSHIRGLAEEDGDASSFYFHPAQFLPDNSEFVIAASRWIIAGAHQDDRLLTPLSSALWLYTGRKGVNATPAEPNVGPSVFDVPGRFLASRVLEDDVTLLLLWNPNFLIARDGAAVQAACPEALQFLQMTDEPARVAIFRIRRDDPCFESQFLGPARAVETRLGASVPAGPRAGR